MAIKTNRGYCKSVARLEILVVQQMQGKKYITIKTKICVLRSHQVKLGI